MIEDKLLIYRCKRGNQSAFQRIYEKYVGELRALAASLLDDRSAAEDVVHDVFISMLQIVDRFELRSSLAGYLKTSVANKARDHQRKKRPQAVAVDDSSQLAGVDGDAVGFAGFTSQADAGFHYNVVLVVSPAGHKDSVACGCGVNAGLNRWTFGWNVPGGCGCRGGKRQA